MATTTVKSTYALDVATVRALDEMAARWGVSKSEALRRAIGSVRLAATDSAPAALDALDALQRELALTGASAAAWAKRSRAERRATSVRGESR